VPQHIRAEGFFIEKFVRYRGERDEEGQKYIPIRDLQIFSAFQHTVKKGMDYLSFESVQRDVALSLAYLVYLRFRAV
jgi:hypothetical protein